MGYRIIKLTLLIEFPSNNPGERVTGMRDSGCELLGKNVVASKLRARDLEEKMMD